MFWCFLLGIVIAAIGVFILLKPNLVWKLTEKWKSYRADEPSDSYLKMAKFGGILYILLGIVITILPLVLE